MKNVISTLILLATASLAPAQQPGITQDLITQVVSEGTTVTFQVAAAGTLPLTYNWYRNSSLTPYATMTLDDTNCALRLPTVAATDAGYFRVNVRNAAGNAWGRTAYLAVLAPRMDTNGFALTIRATTNTQWRIEMSTNAEAGAAWATLTNLTIPRNPPYVRYVDPEGTNHYRFYRVSPRVF